MQLQSHLTAASAAGPYEQQTDADKLRRPVSSSQGADGPANGVDGSRGAATNGHPAPQPSNGATVHRAQSAVAEAGAHAEQRAYVAESERATATARLGAWPMVNDVVVAPPEVVESLDARQTQPDSLASGGWNGQEQQPAAETAYEGRLGEYELAGELGDGAYGTVHLARHKATGQSVAIKRMKSIYLSWKDVLKEMEITIAGELQRHPNIVHMLEAFRDSESQQLYMVFEYMDCNLYQLIKERSAAAAPGARSPFERQWPPSATTTTAGDRWQQQQKAPPTKGFSDSEVRSIAQQILRGLQYLHEKGYFHRDLKPENILCKAGTDAVKLADFGQARSIRSRPPYSEYVSTRWYRAPELVLSSPIYSLGVDIWAIGCIIAEVVMLRPLFDGSSATDQLFKIVKLLGTPTREEWPQGIQMAEKLNIAFPQGFHKQNLAQLIKPCSAPCVQLVAATLHYNPQKRPSARTCLEMEYFGPAGKNSRQAPILPAAGTITHNGKDSRVGVVRAATQTTDHALPPAHWPPPAASDKDDNSVSSRPPVADLRGAASSRAPPPLLPLPLLKPAPADASPVPVPFSTPATAAAARSVAISQHNRQPASGPFNAAAAPTPSPSIHKLPAPDVTATAAHAPPLSDTLHSPGNISYSRVADILHNHLQRSPAVESTTAPSVTSDTLPLKRTSLAGPSPQPRNTGGTVKHSAHLLAFSPSLDALAAGVAGQPARPAERASGQYDWDVELDDPFELEFSLGLYPSIVSPTGSTTAAAGPGRRLSLNMARPAALVQSPSPSQFLFGVQKQLPADQRLHGTTAGQPRNRHAPVLPGKGTGGAASGAAKSRLSATVSDSAGGRQAPGRQRTFSIRSTPSPPPARGPLVVSPSWSVGRTKRPETEVAMTSTAAEGTAHQPAAVRKPKALQRHKTFTTLAPSLAAAPGKNQLRERLGSNASSEADNPLGGWPHEPGRTSRRVSQTLPAAPGPLRLPGAPVLQAANGAAGTQGARAGKTQAPAPVPAGAKRAPTAWWSS